MSTLFTLPYQVPFYNSAPHGLAKLYFYRAGTEVHQPVYTTAALSVAHDQPVRSYADGTLPPIYLNPGATYNYRMQQKTADDVLVIDIDNIPKSGYPSQAEIGAILYPRTAAEISAGVTPTDYSIPSHEKVGYILPARYGMSEAATSAVNVAAMEAAKDVAAQLGGGVALVFDGTFQWDDWTCDENNFVVVGAGRNVTVFDCDDVATSGVAFLFSKGASSIVRSGITNCGFFKNGTETKTAIKLSDARQCISDHIGINSGNWPGTAAIGIHYSGRDLPEFENCDIECARPLLISSSPNYATISFDIALLTRIQFATTEATGKCVEIEDGVEISTMCLDSCDFAGGQYGIYYNDTSSTIASFGFSARNCRFEQGVTASGYSIYLASNAQTIQSVYLENVNFSTELNGLYLRNPGRVTLVNCQFPGTGTNLNITFISVTELQLIGTLIQTGSTVTLTNGVAVVESPYSTSVTAISQNCLYVYDQAALINRRVQRRDGVLSFSYKGTMVDDAQISLPIKSSAGHDVANFRISMGASTGPVLEYANGAWRPGTVVLTGSANTATTNSDGDMCIIDQSNGLSIINRLGLTVDVVLEVIASD